MKMMENKMGMSFVEAIIAVAIFTIGIAGFTVLFSRTWQNNANTYEMGKASLAASQGLNKTVSYIRKTRQGDDGAYPIKTAAGNDLVLFSDYDKDGITERLHFYRDGDRLIMGYRKPGAGLPKVYAAGDEATEVIVENIANGANEPIFYYYNKNYPGSNTNNPMAEPVYVWDVRLIKVLIKVNIEKGRPTDNIELRSFVELRNLNDYSRLTS